MLHYFSSFFDNLDFNLMSQKLTLTPHLLDKLSKLNCFVIMNECQKILNTKKKEKHMKKIFSTTLYFWSDFFLQFFSCILKVQFALKNHFSNEIFFQNQLSVLGWDLPFSKWYNRSF